MPRHDIDVCEQVRKLRLGDTEVYRVDFTDELKGGDTLDGVTKTAAEVGTSGQLTVTSPFTVNTAIETDLMGADRAISTVALVTVSVNAGTAGNTYWVLVTASTTKGRSIGRHIRIRIIGTTVPT